MTRMWLVIIAIVVGLGSVSAWITMQRPPMTDDQSPQIEATGADQPNDRAKKFFGGDPDRDIRGGKELRLQW